MVESDKDLSSLLGEIQETLDDSNFPYKVDLVQFKDFAESYRKSYEKDKARFSEP